MISADWDIDTIIKRCKDLKYGKVELRTTHKHSVEMALFKEEREEVKKKFE